MLAGTCGASCPDRLRVPSIVQANGMPSSAVQLTKKPPRPWQPKRASPTECPNPNPLQDGPMKAHVARTIPALSCSPRRLKKARASAKASRYMRSGTCSRAGEFLIKSLQRICGFGRWRFAFVFCKGFGDDFRSSMLARLLNDADDVLFAYPYRMMRVALHSIRVYHGFAVAFRDGSPYASRNPAKSSSNDFG